MKTRRQVRGWQMELLQKNHIVSMECKGYVVLNSTLIDYTLMKTDSDTVNIQKIRFLSYVM